MNLMFLIPLGALILIVAVAPTLHIIARLPAGATRCWWFLLLLLIFSFVGAYLFFFFHGPSRGETLNRIVMPLVLFGGSLFVLLVSLLSLQTLRAVLKISTLEQENITDPLMGIYNRRGFENRLKEETSRAQRYGLDLSLILIDIDRFKQINDTFGHRNADLVLERIGALLAGAIRDFDIPARYGGDEIAIISPNSRGQDAFSLASRLKECIGSYNFTRDIPELKEPLYCTISVGVASLEPHYNHPDDMLKAADKAMYLAKSEGRNRVCSDAACLPE